MNRPSDPRQPPVAGEASEAAGDHPGPSRAAGRTVYGEIRDRLLEQGWTQGRQSWGRRLTLLGAVDVVVGVDAPPAGARLGPLLVRRARIRRHLRELAHTANLGAWADQRGRTLEQVVELLSLAAAAFPDD